MASGATQPPFSPLSAGKGMLASFALSDTELDKYLYTPAAKPQVLLKPSKPLGRLWDPSTGVLAIGGHRGMGENLLHLPAHEACCGFRENTLASFQACVASGASFIEFDVQITSDGIPVIWHDDWVLSGDPANPTRRRVGDLTLAQFKRLVKAEEQLLRQMKCGGGVAAWTVAQDDEDDLPTLEDLFASLPPHVGFDIEVKMTTPDHVERTPAAEVQRVVGPILDLIARVADSHAPRPLVFSSFDPEVCLELRSRQADIPVLFLSGGGTYAHVDGRRTSIEAAIAFAAAAGLHGLVLETASLQAQEGQVAVARAASLQLYTYGQGNGDAEWLRRQYFLGVQGAIVDDVAGVVMALTASRLTM